MMNPAIKWPLIALGAAVGVAGILIAAIVLTLQQKAAVTREKLGEVDIESFRIADLFKEKLRQANDHMRKHSTDESAAEWQAFLDSNEQLKGWISNETMRLYGPKEQELLKQMDAVQQLY